MRKGTYRSNPNKPVVLIIEVKQDMSDDDFNYELEKSLTSDIANVLKGAVMLNENAEE